MMSVCSLFAYPNIYYTAYNKTQLKNVFFDLKLLTICYLCDIITNVV